MSLTKDLTFNENQEVINLALSGNKSLRAGRYQEAIEIFEKALEKAEDYAEARYNCAICYRKLRNFEKALEYFHLAIKYKKNYAKAYFAIHEIYGLDYRDFAKAKEYYKKYKRYKGFFKKSLPKSF